MAYIEDEGFEGSLHTIISVPGVEAFDGDVDHSHFFPLSEMTEKVPPVPTPGSLSDEEEFSDDEIATAENLDYSKPTNTQFPRVVVRDENGKKLNLDTSYQQQIHETKYRLHQGYHPTQPEEWRLPHSRLPARPDYTRKAPPLTTKRPDNRKLAQRKGFLNSSSLPNLMELLASEGEDLPPGITLEDLEAIPGFSSARTSDTAREPGQQPSFIQFVGSAPATERYLSETEKREAQYVFPGFCSGCRRAGFCYGCEKSAGPHIHQDRPMKTGGGFTFWKRDYPRNLINKNNPLNWKVGHPASHVFYDGVKFPELDEYGVAVKVGKPADDDPRLIGPKLKEKLRHFYRNVPPGSGVQDELPWSVTEPEESEKGIFTGEILANADLGPDVPYTGTIFSSFFNPLERGWTRTPSLSRGKSQDSLKTRTSHTSDLRSGTSLEELGHRHSMVVWGSGQQEPEKEPPKKKYAEFYVPKATSAAEQRRKSLMKKVASALHRKREASIIKEKPKPVEKEPTDQDSGLDTERSKEPEKTKKSLYKAPKAFTVKKSDKKVTVAADPFSKDRDYDIPQGDGFKIKKSDKELTKFVDGPSREGSLWKEPSKFAMKERDKTETPPAKPRPTPEITRKREEEVEIPSLPPTRERETPSRSDSPDSGVDIPQEQFVLPALVQAPEVVPIKVPTPPEDSPRLVSPEFEGKPVLPEEASFPPQKTNFPVLLPPIITVEQDNIEPPEIPVKPRTPSPPTPPKTPPVVQKKDPYPVLPPIPPTSQEKEPEKPKKKEVIIKVDKKPKPPTPVEEPRKEPPKPETPKEPLPVKEPPKEEPVKPPPKKEKKRELIEAPPPLPEPKEKEEVELPKRRTPTPPPRSPSPQPTRVEPPPLPALQPPVPPPLPEYAEPDRPKREVSQTNVEAPPPMPEPPPQRRPPPKLRPRRKRKDRLAMIKKQTVAPVTKQELKQIQDPLDFLAKFCIIHKDRLPHYERVFKSYLAEQHFRYADLPPDPNMKPLPPGRLGNVESIVAATVAAPVEEAKAAPPADAKSKQEVMFQERAAETKDDAGKDTKDGDKKAAPTASGIGRNHITDHERKMIRDLTLINRHIGQEPSGISVPDEVVTKLNFTLDNMIEKYDTLQQKLDDVHLQRVDILATMAKRRFPEVIDPNYSPKKSKKSKKKKKDGKEESKAEPEVGEESSPEDGYPKRVTNLDIVMRLTPSMLQELGDNPEVGKLDLEIGRLEEKLKYVDDRIEELEDEKRMMQLYGRENFFDEETKDEKPEEFRRAQSPLYQRLNPNVDQELNLSEVEEALQQINGHLMSPKEMQYIYFVLDLPNRKRVNMKLFSAIAALSEKIAQVDPFIKKLINKVNFEALNIKMEGVKELFYLLDEDDDDIPKGMINVQNLMVELMAGGVTSEHVQYVVNKFNREKKGIVDFMDFLIYVPLFIEIHSRIVKDPLSQEQDL